MFLTIVAQIVTTYLKENSGVGTYITEEPSIYRVYTIPLKRVKQCHTTQRFPVAQIAGYQKK